VFWREFFPRFNAPTPPRTQRLLNYLAQERFGGQFDSQHGTVRFTRPQMLREGLNEAPPGRKNDPHVAFFLERNPDCVHGDELVCLTDLGPENLTAAGRRMMTPQSCAIDSNHR
jgi:hypothetical protein